MKTMPALLTVLLIAGLVILPAATAAAKDADPYRAGIDALRAGDSEIAISHLTLAIQQNPTNHRYYNDRGVAYKRSGNLEAALADYSRALEIEPGYANALNNRGVVYLNQGRLDEAIADFHDALKSERLKQKIHTNIGIAYAKKGDHQKAVEHLSEAISFGPRDYRSYFFLAESLRHMGSVEKALKMYQLALGLSTNREVTRELEGLIARLEKGSNSSVTTDMRRPDDAKDSGKKSSPAHKTSLGPSGASANGTRTVVRAGTLPGKTPARTSGAEKAEDSPIRSLQELDERSRSSAVTRLAPLSSQIYLQGREFLKKSDTAKALVRFEDTRQLERRKRGYFGVAWSDLEIGRAYSALGEHHKAAPYYEEALRLFRRLKSRDEIILALVELAKNQRVLRGNDQASILYRKAIEAAVAAGHYTLARGVGELSERTSPKPVREAAKKPAKPSAKNEALRVTESERSRKAARVESPRRDSRKLDGVGSGPIRWGRGEAVSKKSRLALITKDRRESAAKKARQPRTEQQPKRVVFWAKEAEPTAKRRASRKRKARETSKEERLIRKDLNELRKLKGKHDERKMVVVLERLSDRYAKQKDYVKALHCLDASMGFRDELPYRKGQSTALEHRGRIKEKLGRNAEALEDVSRAITYGKSEARTRRDALKARAKELARKMGLDADAALETLNALWKAREEQDGLSETRALYQLGQIYERSGKTHEARKYFKRTSASMLADKARLHEKMGQADLARKLFRQAMEAFKEVDYSRFIELKRKSNVPNTISRQ